MAPRFIWLLSSLAGALWTLAALGGCSKTELLTDPDAALRFSTDTLTFDTVFTEMGVATRKFKVYNPYDQPVKISHIRLAGGAQSKFRLNIDGTATTEALDVEIPANDSLYVFANVFIDPNNADNPLVVYDSVLFETNGQPQRVVLQAWGQDAVYLGQVGYYTWFTGANLIFTPDKPYVLMGIVGIDSFSTLTIQAGTRVHMFGGPTSTPGARALLYVGDGSTLRVEGTAAAPVQFVSHRLENEFDDLPFQWEGIRFGRFSRDNVVEHAIIRNALYGLWVDSLSTNARPKLTVRHTFVYNVAEAGILGINGSIYAENTVVANSVKWNALLVYGGDYTFNHCTFANYGTGLVSRQNKPLLAYRNYFVAYDTDGNEIVLEAPGRARFTNCILYGSQFSEIDLDKGENTTAPLDWLFKNCLVKADTLSYNLVDSYKNLDPRFVDPDAYDFHLDTIISPARNTGLPGLTDFNGQPILYDLDGRPRDGQPDLGAYEFPE
jgi:hypothetical protein